MLPGSAVELWPGMLAPVCFLVISEMIKPVRQSGHGKANGARGKWHAQ